MNINDDTTKRIDIAKENSEKELNEYYDNCLRSLEDCRLNSENDFESKITYITAGALGISITIFKDYNAGIATGTLLASWWLLLISLLVNCFSAHCIKSMCVKTSKVMKECKANERCKNFTKPIESINSVSKWYNRITIYSFISGILLIVIFIILNYIS